MNKKDLKSLFEAYEEVVDVEYSPEDAFKNEHEESQMVISSLKIAQKKIETIIEVEPVIEPVVEVEVKLESTYDPKATDGDKDGFVQDGTEFQRPVEETN